MSFLVTFNSCFSRMIKSLFVSLLIVLLNLGGAECQLDTECLERNEKDLCIRCLGIINRPSRKCTNSCDTEDIRLSLTDDSFRGRVCYEKDGWTQGDQIILITGTCIGSILFIFLVIAIGMCIYHRKKKRRIKRIVSQSKYTNGVDLVEQNDKESSKKEYFILMIEQLRPDAPVILEMLNRTRRKYQNLNRENETVKAKTLKNCMRDLGRILFMINLREDKIKVPPDSDKLIQWTLKVLNNYKNNRKSISSTKDAAITKLNGKYVNRVRPKSVLKNNRPTGEVHLQIESNSISNRNGASDKDVEEELFGTYVTQREDGTAIMTTEL